MQPQSFLNILKCNITSNVCRLLLILTFLHFNITYAIPLNKLNFKPIANVRPKLSYITLSCRTNRNSELWANKFSRSSPEMDLIKSTVNNLYNDLGPLVKYIDVPNVYYYKQMEELMKRGIQMSKIKKFFFRPKTKVSDYSHPEEVFIPYFRDPDPIIIDGVTKQPREPNLIGRDLELYKDGEFALPKARYTLEDVLCQELISAFLMSEKLSDPNLNFYLIPKEDLLEEISKLEKKDDPESEELKELIEDSIVLSDDLFPISLNKYNREYLQGLEKIKKSGLDYPKVLDNYNLLHLNKAKQVLDKLLGNIRLYIQVTNNVDLSNLYSKMLKPLENNEESFGKWTEYISTPLLSHMYKYSKLESPGAVDKLPEFEVNTDLLEIYLEILNTKYKSHKESKELEKLRNQYIEFSMNRRRGPKLLRRPMPYWIWYEFWRNRDEFMHENMLELLRDIVIGDPKVDLREALKGTIEHFFKAFVPPTISKRGTGRILESVIDADNRLHNSNIKKIVDLMNDYSYNTKSKIILKKGKDEVINLDHEKEKEVSVINLDEVIDKIVELKNRNCKERKNDQFIKLADVVDEQDNSPEKKWKREIIERDAEDLEVKPFGYNFKDILSFDKFEEAYRKFNLKNFGSEDYSLHKGQLVKGKVVNVSRTEVLVDIHAFSLGTLKLNGFYETPSEVPLGGFKRVFSPGDELMFEVTEIWSKQIILSLRNVMHFHKFKNILKKREKGHVFYARVIQLYTEGILVKYVPDYEAEKELEGNTEDMTEDNINLENRENPNQPLDQNKINSQTDEDLTDTAWIPKSELNRKYREPTWIYKRNLLGKIIPVIFKSYDSFNKIPILSNKEAYRKMQIVQLKKGDIVKGIVKTYKPYYIGLRFGTLSGTLSVDDMSDEGYRQHLIECPRCLVCKVKYVDPHRDIIHLTSKGMYDLKDADLESTNLFRRKVITMKLSETVKAYNSSLDAYRQQPKSPEPPSSYSPDQYRYSYDSDTNSIELGPTFLNENSKSQKEISFEDTLSTPHSKQDPMEGLVEWNFDGEKLLDDPKLTHGYNRLTWFIHFGNWFQLPADVQSSLNYQFNNNNQVGYFFLKGDKYRILFDENVAVCTKKGHSSIFKIKSSSSGII